MSDLQRNDNVIQRNPNAAFELATLLGQGLRRCLKLDGVSFAIETTHPIAYESPDHLSPWGAWGNSGSDNFNVRLLRWIPIEKLSVLDLGCAGGKLVEDLHNLGATAVGIDGTDLNRRLARNAWARIPGNLFTADLAKPFQLFETRSDERRAAKFSVITAWEFIEHIAKPDLPQVFSNISNHLEPEGVVIMSVCPIGDCVNGVEMHQTIEARSWWLDFIKQQGFYHHEYMEDYFAGDYIRGGNNEGGPSFHLIMTRSNVPVFYRENLVNTAIAGWQDFLVLRSEYEKLHWAVVDLLNRVQRLEQDG